MEDPVIYVWICVEDWLLQCVVYAVGLARFVESHTCFSWRESSAGERVMHRECCGTETEVAPTSSSSQNIGAGRNHPKTFHRSPSWSLPEQRCRQSSSNFASSLGFLPYASGKNLSKPKEA